MSTEQLLQERSNNSCELCASTDHLNVYAVPFSSGDNADNSVLICDKCLTEMTATEALDATHWRCLNDSMWSQTPAVQVMAYRMLTRLSTETWAMDLLDMLYLEDDVKAWAQAGLAVSNNEHNTPTLDSNGASLQDGDNVTLIKDLVVKGAGFTAKRGSVVRNINLTDNPEQIEGKINGMKLVLLSCYMKKA
jgi:protein PhnA